MASAIDIPARELAASAERVVQLLGPDGVRLSDPDWNARGEAIDDGVLGRMYEDMVVVRQLDRTATNLQRQGQLALWPPLLGQEAAQVGSARMLQPGDFAFSSYREHAVAYCRGATPTDLVRVWRGVTASGWNPYSIGMATPQVVIAAQALHATGWALGALWEGAGQAAIAYFGDGATSEGDLAEAMIFAVAYGAPVVFFCQNNGWAISEPVSLQTPVSIAARAAAFGMPAVTVDGNDVLAVAAVTAEALERARAGRGPSFIEAMTYRMGPHTTADDPTRYREDADLADWLERDPVRRLRTHLEGTGALDAERVRAVDELAVRAAAEMRAGCTGLPDPGPFSVFEHVYVEDHPDLARQRARYARHLAAFADEPGGDA